MISIVPCHLHSSYCFGLTQHHCNYLHGGGGGGGTIVIVITAIKRDPICDSVCNSIWHTMKSKKMLPSLHLSSSFFPTQHHCNCLHSRGWCTVVVIISIIMVVEHGFIQVALMCDGICDRVWQAMMGTLLLLHVWCPWWPIKTKRAQWWP